MELVQTAIHDFCGTYFFWFPDFAQSPGFAGCLAVVAAAIAYIATTRNARQEQWWKRAEFALNLTLSAEETTQIAGLEMLDALNSKSKSERAFIEAATQWFLNKEPSGPTESADIAAGSRTEGSTTANGQQESGQKRAPLLGSIRGIFRRPRA